MWLLIFCRKLFLTAEKRISPDSLPGNLTAFIT